MATDTSEIDPIRGYLDAVQAYEQERTKAKTLIDRISTVANAMQNHLPGVDPVRWTVCRLGRFRLVEHLRLIGDRR